MRHFNYRDGFKSTAEYIVSQGFRVIRSWKKSQKQIYYSVNLIEWIIIRSLEKQLTDWDALSIYIPD
jgi:hypothetical protein